MDLPYTPDVIDDEDSIDNVCGCGDQACDGTCDIDPDIDYDDRGVVMRQLTAGNRCGRLQSSSFFQSTGALSVH